MNSPGLQRRGGGTHRAETTHTNMRGRVVSHLMTEDERGGFHTWGDLMTSESTGYCQLGQYTCTLCLSCVKLEILVLNHWKLQEAAEGDIIFNLRCLCRSSLLPVDRPSLAILCPLLQVLMLMSCLLAIS